MNYSVNHGGFRSPFRSASVCFRYAGETLAKKTVFRNHALERFSFRFRSASVMQVRRYLERLGGVYEIRHIGPYRALYRAFHRALFRALFGCPIFPLWAALFSLGGQLEVKRDGP